MASIHILIKEFAKSRRNPTCMRLPDFNDALLGAFQEGFGLCDSITFAHETAHSRATKSDEYCVSQLSDIGES